MQHSCHKHLIFANKLDAEHGVYGHILIMMSTASTVWTCGYYRQYCVYEDNKKISTTAFHLYPLPSDGTAPEIRGATTDLIIFNLHWMY